MKKKGGAGLAFVIFCAIISLLTWLAVWVLPIKGNTAALLASASIIIGIGLFVIQLMGKREVAGFYFLGSVVFKMFALGFLAIYRKDFAEQLLWYFLLFWLLLAAEVGYTLYAVKKEAPPAL